MKYILNFFIAIFFGAWFTLIGMKNETILSFEWVGIALGISLALFSGWINKQDIDKLNKEIEDLKNKNNI